MSVHAEPVCVLRSVPLAQQDGVSSPCPALAEANVSGKGAGGMSVAPSMRGRITFLTTGLAYGGAETQLFHLATRLKLRGWQVGIVSMLPPAAYVTDLAAAGIPVASLHMRRRVPDPRAVFRLAAILRKWRPHVLHCHMVHANLLGRVARAVRCTVPVLICTAHSIHEGARWRELAYRLTDRWCDLTTQVSDAGMRRYVAVGATPPLKVRVVPNGVDTTIFAPNPEVRERVRFQLGLQDQFVWITVGRFEPPKDYANLMNAFACVVKGYRGCGVVLVIVGEGPLRSAVEQIAGQLGIQDRVYFLGIRRDVPDLMNAADAFVLASAWEGLPLVLLEAAAVGLPIVATNVGGNGEVVQDGVTGFLVPPADSESLACAMLRLMSVPGRLRCLMGESGRQHVLERYALDRVVDTWEELYATLLRTRMLRYEPPHWRG